MGIIPNPVRGWFGQIYSWRSHETTAPQPSTLPPWKTAPQLVEDASAEALLIAFSNMPVWDSIAHLQSTSEGLTDFDASTRLTINGPNVLPSQKAPSKLLLLIKVIPNPFNILLLILAIINVSIPPPDWVCALHPSKLQNPTDISILGGVHGPYDHGGDIMRC